MKDISFLPKLVHRVKTQNIQEIKKDLTSVQLPTFCEKNIYLFLPLIIILYISGCAANTSIKVNIFKQPDLIGITNAAVFRFEEDASIKDKATKKGIIGIYTNPQAGDILARIFSQELAESGLFSVIDRGDVQKQLKAIGLDETRGIQKNDYDVLKNSMGINAIIIGTFKEFGFLYPTIVPRTIVKFNAVCMDIDTGKPVWSIKVADQSSSEKDERLLARNHIKRAINELKKNLAITD